MKNLIITALLTFLLYNLGISQNYIDTIYFDSQGIDAYTKSTESTTNFGTDTCLRVYWDHGSPSKNYYSYFKADFSHIPSSAIVSDAVINFYAVEVNNGAAHSAQLQRVTTSWTETGITWSSPPNGIGTDAVTMTDSATSVLGWQSFNITGITRYQVTNPSLNYGCRMLLSAQSGTVDKGFVYASREHSNSVIRPYVIVQYYIPPCDTIYFEASKDAKVSSRFPTTNYGQDSSLAVNWTSGTPGSANRSFLHADLSHIPKNSLISTATIHLHAQSVDNTASHPMYIEGVNATGWFEDTISWANQPTVWAAYRSGISHTLTSTTGWQVMSIPNLAKYAVWLPEKNFGWRIALQNETGTNSNGVIYASAEHDSVELRPYMVIEYLPPIEITAQVNHCTNGNNDGVINNISISGGCELYTAYNWRKLSSGVLSNIESGTDFSLIDVSSLSAGLYLLEISDYRSQTGYKYFFVGEEGEITSVNFNHINSAYKAKFTEDARFQHYKSTGDSISVGGSSTAIDCYTNSTSLDSKSVMQYKVDWDPSLDFTAVNQILGNKSGCYQLSNSDNDAWLSRITEPWGEYYVNWATQPEVSNIDRVYIPTTTTNGLENRDDTISILPLVPFWQQNPTENFGIQLALNSYNQAASAYRSYVSSDIGGTFGLMVSYTVKPRIETVFYDSLDLGDITVNAPAGELPFTYLIAYDTLPVLDSIWVVIKDSAYVDSLTFFRGNSNTRNYTFEGMPSGRYFVGVYDNNGVKIMDAEAVLSPKIEIIDNVDISISSDNEFSPGATGTGTGTLYAVLPMGEAGGFEFELINEDSLYIGFNRVDDTLATRITDYEFGLRFGRASGIMDIILEGVVVDNQAVSISDKIKIFKSTTDFIVFVNNEVVFQDTIPLSVYEDLKIDMNLFRTSKLQAISVLNKYKSPRPVSKVLRYPECGQTTGDFQLIQPKIPVGTTLTINSAALTNNNGTGPNYTLTAPNHLMNNVAVGTYTFVYSYTITYTTILGPISTTYTISEQVAIGYPVIWNILDPQTAIVSGTLNTIQSLVFALPSFANIDAKDLTSSYLGLDNWIQFQTDVLSYLYPTIPFSSEVFSLSSGGLNVASLTTSHSILGAPISGSGAFSGLTNFSTPNGVYRFEENSGAFEVYKNGATLLGSGASVVPGPYNIQIAQIWGRPLYINTVTSYCFVEGPDQYVTPKRKLDGGYYLVPMDDLLRFEFYEEYAKAGDLKFVVLDYKGEEPWTGLAPTLTEEFGDNRISLDVSGLVGGYYILEIFNDKNEKWFLRFQVQ